MRKLFAFLFLVVLAAGVWLGARWVAHRGEIKATIVFRQPVALQRGDPVVADGVRAGDVTSVDRIDDRDAITVRLTRQHRRAILGDSLFTVEDHRLIVSNAVAVGAPVADGDIIEAKQDRVSQWLAKHGAAVSPFLARIRSKADETLDKLDADTMSRRLDERKAEVPDWKSEGKASFDKHLDEVKARVEKAEDEMRRHNKDDEARKLKERFEKWLEDVRK